MKTKCVINTACNVSCSFQTTLKFLHLTRFSFYSTSLEQAASINETSMLIEAHMPRSTIHYLAATFPLPPIDSLRCFVSSAICPFTKAIYLQRALGRVELLFPHEIRLVRGLITCFIAKVSQYINTQNAA